MAYRSDLRPLQISRRESSKLEQSWQVEIFLLYKIFKIKIKIKKRKNKIKNKKRNHFANRLSHWICLYKTLDCEFAPYAYNLSI